MQFIVVVIYDDTAVATAAASAAFLQHAFVFVIMYGVCLMSSLLSLPLTTNRKCKIGFCM